MKEIQTGGQESQEQQNQSHLEITQAQENDKKGLATDIRQMELDNSDSVSAIR